jgi:hypothetical protein
VDLRHLLVHRSLADELIEQSRKALDQIAAIPEGQHTYENVIKALGEYPNFSAHFPFFFSSWIDSCEISVFIFIPPLFWAHS